MSKCNCLREYEKLIKECFLENNNVECIDEVSFLDESFMITGGSQLSSQVVIEYTQKNKKGELKSKKKRVTMLYKFCPMCGKSYSE